MNIGFKIKKLREQKKQSQEMLSDHLKIGQTTLSNIENGCTDKIDFLLMDKICKLFKQFIDQFIYMGDNDYTYDENVDKIYKILVQLLNKVLCTNVLLMSGM